MCECVRERACVRGACVPGWGGDARACVSAGQRGIAAEPYIAETLVHSRADGVRSAHARLGLAQRRLCTAGRPGVRLAQTGLKFGSKWEVDVGITTGVNES